jgi:chemotaxis protein methyltransferase CheR
MSHPPAKTEELTPAQATNLRNLLASYCGVYLDDSRRSVLRAAVGRRAALAGLSSAAYLDRLGDGADQAELQRLSELILNHETLFFRNRPHMQALATAILPELHRRLPPGEPLRLWSAGCASGEEPYSIAISVLEALGDPLPRPVEILATDLSAQVLAKARAALYRGRTLSNLTAQQRARYFEPRGDSLVVAERVRRMVRFEQRNLLEPFPPELRGVHAVFCQNVTIYFQLDTCRDLMGRIYQTMAEGGALFLGFSETLWNIFDRFRWREVGGAYVYYKESQPLPATAPLSAAPAARPPPLATRQRAAPRVSPSLFAGPEVAERGRELLDAGLVDQALDLFYTAPLAGAHAPQILALAARAHANRGDLDLAVAEARRALELSPLTTEAHLLIGLIYARQGQALDAIRQLERARYLDAGSALIAYHLAECYRQAGRAAAALREYQNALRRLEAEPPDKLVDGVAVGWLSETCRRYLAQLGKTDV